MSSARIRARILHASGVHMRGVEVLRGHDARAGTRRSRLRLPVLPAAASGRAFSLPAYRRMPSNDDAPVTSYMYQPIVPAMPVWGLAWLLRLL